jgi:hypothetical protein
VYDDFVNVERHSHSCSVLLVDDIFPNHPVQARRDRTSRHWTGDVWKFVGALRSARPDLIVLPVDTSPTGTLVVLAADPDNETLVEAFDWAVSGLIGLDSDPPDDVLGRRDAVAPDDPLLIKALGMVRELRETSDPRAGLGRLRNLIDGGFPRQVTSRV